MTGVGRGKAILLGEHAVVYGHPALAVGLPRGARAEVAPSAENELVIDAWGLEVRARADAPEPLARAFHALLSTYGDLGEPVRVTLELELPGGAGLGGSAACGVAIADALSERISASRAPAENAARALAWERIFHGNPSGVDTAISAAGGVGTFRKAQGLEPVPLGAPLHLVVIDSGERAHTKTMVERLAARRASDPEGVTEKFARIDALVREATGAVAAGALETLGRCMTQNHALLRDLELSTPSLDAIVEAALAAAALGAKLTGSGGGGCALALAESAAHAEHIREALGAPGRFTECFEVTP